MEERVTVNHNSSPLSTEAASCDPCGTLRFLVADLSDPGLCAAFNLLLKRDPEAEAALRKDGIRVEAYNPPRLLTVAEVAARLKLSPVTVRRRALALGGVRLGADGKGGDLRFLEPALNDYLLRESRRQLARRRLS